MRRTAVALGILGIIIATTVVVWAEERQGRVDAQTFAWTTEESTTQSTDWQAIPDLSLTTKGCHDNRRASATLSLEIADSPVEVRVQVRNPLCPSCEPSFLNPDGVTLSPGSGSFTFVGKAVGDHGTAFTPEWRLTADAAPNASAVLEGGTLQVLWKKVRGLCA